MIKSQYQKSIQEFKYSQVSVNKTAIIVRLVPTCPPEGGYPYSIRMCCLRPTQVRNGKFSFTAVCCYSSDITVNSSMLSNISLIWTDNCTTRNFMHLHIIQNLIRYKFVARCIRSKYKNIRTLHCILFDREFLYHFAWLVNLLRQARSLLYLICIQ